MESTTYGVFDFSPNWGHNRRRWAVTAVAQRFTLNAATVGGKAQRFNPLFGRNERPDEFRPKRFVSWIRLDDQIPRHDKIAQAGPAASWIWVCCIAHCQSQLTDGFVSETAMRVILTTACAADFEAAHQSGRPIDEVYTTIRALTERLLASKLLDRAENGYLVHDYLTHNPSKENVLQKRRDDLQRKGQFRADSARNPPGIRADSENFPPADSSRARAPAPASDPIRSIPNKQQQSDGPVFEGQRFVVMPFMQQSLERILGSMAESFDLHAWYFGLDEVWAKKGAVNTEWPWLKRQLLREAKTRGLLLGSMIEINDRENGNGHHREKQVPMATRGRNACHHDPPCERATDCAKRTINENRIAEGRPVLP